MNLIRMNFVTMNLIRMNFITVLHFKQDVFVKH